MHNQLLQIHTLLNIEINAGNCIVATFVDISRAFDSVLHKGQIYKLHDFKFPIFNLRFLYNYLQNQSAQIQVHSFFSSPFPISTGVLQGSPLSPIL